MEKIQIEKTEYGFGFMGKTERHTLEAVKFKNGKIVYSDTDDTIRIIEREADLKSYPALKIVEGS